MSKLTQQNLLQRAETSFLKKEYRASLRSYGIILEKYPFLDEAKIGIYLSDLGIQKGEEAQALFDYYYLIKDEKSNALEIIDEMITKLDDIDYELEKHLLEPLKEIEYGDGIKYSDFLALVESSGNFKEIFEDIMFSTKVILSTKYEFIDFVTQLSQEGFKEMALRYLDGSNTLFGNDQEVLALYNIIEGKTK